MDYDINLSNRGELIYRVENLDYSAYLNNDYYDDWYEGITSYVDRDLIDFLKNRIDKDIGFRLSPFYQHNLLYSFLGEYYSNLNLTYKDNYIYNIKEENNQSLLLSQTAFWSEFKLYLNFHLIPHVSDDVFSLMLNNLFFVRMKVDYKWVYGYLGYHDHSYEQYLLLDENLTILLIFIRFDVFID